MKEAKKVDRCGSVTDVFVEDLISTQQSIHIMRWVPFARRAALTTMRPRTSTRHRGALAAVVPSPTTVAADARRRPQESPTLNAVAAAAAVVRCRGGAGGAVVARFFEEDDGT